MQIEINQQNVNDLYNILTRVIKENEMELRHATGKWRSRIKSESETAMKLFKILKDSRHDELVESMERAKNIP